MSIATLVPIETGAALTAVPGLRHGFFGRQGGVSSGPYESLNVSDAGGDKPELAARNRAIAARELGFAPERLVTVAQVHGSTVVTLTEAPAGGSRPEADGMVTRMDGLALGILTADCAPVLLADPDAHVIGAAHAGWKGALSGIVGATVDAMTALGARPESILAAIGPTIAGQDYEVGETFRSEFLGHDPDAEAFFTTPPGGSPHFDLPRYVAKQLERAGIRKIEAVGGSTYGDPSRYFAHRFATHAGTVTGRQLSLIGWPEAPPAVTS